MRTSAIRTARPDGRAVVGLFPEVLQIAWSPNGRRMAVAAGAAGAVNFEVNISLIPSTATCAASRRKPRSPPAPPPGARAI